MLDINLIREEPERVRKSMQDRQQDAAPVDQIFHRVAAGIEKRLLIRWPDNMRQALGAPRRQSQAGRLCRLQSVKKLTGSGVPVVRPHAESALQRSIDVTADARDQRPHRWERERLFHARISAREKMV